VDTLLDKLIGFADRQKKNVLVIEPDAKQRRQVAQVIDDEEVEIISVSNRKAALKELSKKKPIDCIILNPQQLDIAQSLIDSDDETKHVLTRLPIIIYGNDDIDEVLCKRLGELCLVGQAHTPERLLDLASLFLHRNIAKLPEAQRKKLLDLHQSDKILAGKRVLIVDDDMRNIFALSSVLEEHQMIITSADNGRDAIKILQEHKDMDIVLMDIMMPEMDGMETMREIRKFPHLKNLPIVAVTAKAMKGDREKCIEAGAWDYLSKPVDTEQMLSVLRAWLHRT
jgi:CheY-like chemotaxis protein